MNTRTRLQEIRREEQPVRGEVDARQNDAAIAMSFPLYGPCRMPAPIPVPVKVPVPVKRPLERVRGAWNLFAALAALALLSAAPAQAAHGNYGNLDADGRIVDVGIRVEGQRAPLFVKNGDWNRWYFQAFEGQNYSIVLRNNTGRRVGVLVAVDGLNVVNGEKSRLKSGEPMYVLGPWGSAEIAGWRTSLQQIRRFVFVDEEISYASRTGQANGDMGWIRVLAFEEKRPWKGITPELRYDDEPRSGREKPGELDGDRARREAPEAQNAPRVAEPEAGDRKAQQFHGGQQSFPGTGWGDRDYDPVRRVDFTPSRNATDHLVLRYEYASGLRALGIFPPRKHRIWERDSGHLGFAKPPKW